MPSQVQRSEPPLSPDDYLGRLSVEQSRLSRRLRLLIFALASISLGLVLLLSILPGRVQREIGRLGEQRLREVARHLVLLTDQIVVQHQELLRGIAAQPQTVRLFEAQARGDLSQAEIDRYHAQLAGLLRGMKDQLQGIFLVPPNGVTFAGVLQNGDASPYVQLHIGDRSYVHDTFVQKKELVTDPMYSKVSNLPIIVLTEPVFDESGKMIGLVGLSLRIGYLSQLLASEKIGESGYPFAIDRQGRMVAHPDSARFFTKVLLEKAKADELVEGMLAGRSGVARYRSSLGDDKIAAYEPVPVCGWSVAATINLDEYEAPARHIRFILLATLAFVVVLGVCIGAILMIGIRRLRIALDEVRGSERKIAEQAALLDQTRDSILVQDLDNRIRFWNEGAHRTYGWKAEEALGEFHDKLLRIDRRRFETAYERVLADGSWQGRMRKVSKYGATLSVDNRWTLLRNEDGKPYAILSIGTDITEREQAEERMRSSQRLESLGTLAGGIAHDLNNLLFPIIMGVNLLREELKDPEQLSVLDTVEQSASRGAQLVQQVLAFSRGTKGSLVSVHAGLVLREIAAILSSTFPKNIELKTVVAEDLHLVRADPAQLCQILMNLCINARDAMPNGGTLRVAIRNVFLDAQAVEFDAELKPGRHLCIEVADTGVGIPRDILPKIFDPFFSTKGPSKGTGLGLSTVMGIIRSYHGSIHVYSEEGTGTTFKLYLPALDDPSKSRVREGEPEVVELQGRNRVVLLVDDEASVRKLGKRLLESKGFVVLTAESGEQAWALFEQGPSGVDVVLTDIMMPGMDGVELIGRLRGATPTPVIIGMSGLVDSHLPPAALSYSVPLLSKPIMPQELYATLRSALGD